MQKNVILRRCKSLEMKRIAILIIVAFATLSAQAQDEMIFSHYIMNPVLINPAASGFNNQHNFLVHYKNQWTGFDGAPRTVGLNYNGPIGEKLGFGAFASNENAANLSRFRGLLSYAFKFKINDLKGSLGLSTEFKRLSLNASVLNNGLYKPGDNIAEQSIAGQSYFDATMGAYGVYMDKFIFSVAMPNLIQARLSDIAGNSTTRGGLRYFNVMMGLKQQVGAVKIEPSLFFQKMIDAPFRVDLNLKGSFLNERVIGAVGYRAGTGGGIGVMVGTKINGLTFAYSYDYGMQRFQQYSGGAHELTIGYSIDQKKLISKPEMK